MSLSRASCLLLFWFLLSWTALVTANVEKIIFTAPESIDLSEYGPALKQLHLHSLSPSHPQLRLLSPTIFTNASHPKGLSSWYVLHDLTPKARYEIRICWPASQPAKWDLDAYSVPELLAVPEIHRDVESYASQYSGAAELGDPSSISAPGHSVMLLRLHALADFFSLHKDLMTSPPSVHIDLILDPYLLNIVPASLIPTAIYVLCIALIGVLASNRIWHWLERQMEPLKSHAH